MTLILILFYQRALFWDESYYYENVVNFLNPTISHIAFIKDLKGPAGPAHAYFHAIFHFATKGEGLYVRILNFSFIFLGVFLSDSFKIKNNNNYFNLKLLLLPSFYPILGLALTETIPLISSFFIVLNLKKISKIKSKFRVVLLIILISLSILGRQQYLVVPIGLIVHQIVNLILINRRIACEHIIIAFSALIFPVIYFFIWGGIQPPSTSFVEKGFSVEHFSLALFIAALFDIIISEGLIKILWNRAVLLLFVFTLLLQLLFIGEYEYIPFHEITQNTYLEPLHEVSWMVLLLIISSYYLSVKIFEYFDNITEGNLGSLYILIYLGFLFTNIKINHLFAARYVVPSMVFLLAIKNEKLSHSPITLDFNLLRGKITKIIVKFGLILVGVVHLISYYNYE